MKDVRTKSRWGAIVIKDVAHHAYWNGRNYKTDCGILTTTWQDRLEIKATYCPECYPV